MSENSSFLDQRAAEKYYQLGFSDAEFSLKLTIGSVSINAVEHPFNGIILIFESITARTMCQYESSLPVFCSKEQIAGLIYVNIAENFRDHKLMFKNHFQSRGLPLFQLGIQVVPIAFDRLQEHSSIPFQHQIACMPHFLSLLPSAVTSRLFVQITQIVGEIACLQQQ
jgi:hypothetical protein